MAIPPVSDLYLLQEHLNAEQMDPIVQGFLSQVGRGEHEAGAMVKLDALALIGERIGMFAEEWRGKRAGGPPLRGRPRDGVAMDERWAPYFSELTGRWHYPLVPGSGKWWLWYRKVTAFLARAQDLEQWQIENRRLRGRKRTAKGKRPKCGAKCRDGTACQARPVWDKEHNRPRNGRCRMHGGLSTGAKTAEGRKRLREAGRRGAAARWGEVSAR